MRLIYENEVLRHNPLEDTAEGSYRLSGLEEVGTLLDLNFEVRNDVLRVHTERHLQKVIGSCNNRTPTSEITPDKKTLEAIFSSVRLAIYASENNDLAMTRPPGHHAGKETMEGFCFLNNMAIAAQRLVYAGKKVCIIDIDGHHCNGTQGIFNQSSDVMVCSIFEEGRYGSTRKTITDIGAKEGKGTKLNLPIPSMSGDDVLLKSLNFFKPYLLKFNPDIIGVSLGLDGYYKDHLLNLRYTSSGFNQFGFELKQFGYPVFATLEGGYHEDVVKCASAFVEGINGTPTDSTKLSLSNEEVISRFEINKRRLEGKLNEILRI